MVVVAFQPFHTVAKTVASSYRRNTGGSRLNVVPGVETIGIALVSAAMGAVSQQPRMNALQEELTEVKGSLEQSQQQMVTKISQLEDRLFQMDNAYEEQSAKFMKEYEERKNREVQKITDKIRTDYQYKLDIEVEKEKSKVLTQTWTDVTLRGDQSAKLSEMKLKMEQLRNAKRKLEMALEKSETELERRLGGDGKKKGGFWPF